MLELSREECIDPDRSASLEWLETNGIGGFASSTVSGISTRRYHSILTAAAKPPLGRVRMLSRFEELLTIGDREYSLSSNRFPGTLHPRGFRYIESFRLDPFPVWTLRIPDEDLEIRKKIFAVHGENTVVCSWEIVPGLKALDEPVSLEILPLMSFVDYHAIRREDDAVDQSYIATQNCVWMRPENDLPEIFFNHNASSVNRTGDWYHNFEYPVEEERGFDFHEDLFQPFSLDFDLLKEPAVMIVSTRQINFSDSTEFEAAEKVRREGLCEIAGAESELERRLVVAADQFIVSRGEGHTVIAGYPWFSDWGRDTMISLPGLTLATKREGIAKDILLEFSRHLSQGMIPNRFPDVGETPEYNTVDATLWFIEAARAYDEHTGDHVFIRKELFPRFRDVIKAHLEGTRYGIRVDEDGLLEAGEPGTNLTWMDAKYGDETFTPRIGKPVEIQALWYNALMTMKAFATRFKHRKKARKYEALAERAKASFNKKFWNADAECLYDVLTTEGADASIRPNQIYAVSLHYSMLSHSRARKVVQTVEKELFTPYGLRSLERDDPRYCPVYIGSPYDRDSAYHQGTVWAWPMGAFIESLRKTYPKGRKLNQYIELIFDSFLEHTEMAGLGQVSEIFDGDDPHTPRGCFAQAWSVAELLRVIRSGW